MKGNSVQDKLLVEMEEEKGGFGRRYRNKNRQELGMIICQKLEKNKNLKMYA